jgi:penicillin amidase
MTTWGTRLLALGCLGAIVALVLFSGGLVGLSAPYSGTAWETVDDRGPTSVETPYGPATVTYDEHGVPHVEADSTAALYYAVGYVQARDRLFQMDLFRRQMAGRLSAVFGNSTVGSDSFHRQMDFEGAADRKWESLQDTGLGDPIRAYSAGVNAYIDRGPLPLEFRLNGYEPARWEPADTILVGMRATWGLSGEFSDLKRATVRDRLSGAASLYSSQLDHDSSILAGAVGGERTAGSAGDSTTASRSVGDFGALYESVERFGRDPGLGSNNWVVSGNASTTGEPMLANDPHLQLLAPPVWYEMNLSAPELGVRGVAFPGAPMVLIGDTGDVAWGITNVGADVTDVYSYEWRGEEYYHDGEWRQASVENETIAVDGAPDRTITVRKTVHGPVLEREGRTVAVSWLGLTDTREPLAFYQFNRADDLGEFRDALANFDMPASNVVAASEDGTLYRASGTYPIRRTDGEVVRGDRVFNGSADEGTWRGFTPYGESDLDGPGFVDDSRVPGVENPDLLGTANQRVADDPGFYMGTPSHFAPPFRGARVTELLDRYRDDGGVSPAEMRAMQRDTTSRAARTFAPIALDARSEMDGDALAAADRLAEWDYRMTADSRAALVYDRWFAHFRNQTFADEFYGAGLDGSHYPNDWRLATLANDSRWFDDRTTDAVETRRDIAARAMEAAVAEIEREGWARYGDANRLEVPHPFGGAAPFLSYPAAGPNGSGYTLFNVRTGGSPPAGSSWRMIVHPGREGQAILPGGNDGSYWSPHYDDQFADWRTGRYRALWAEADGEPDITFEGGDG